MNDDRRPVIWQPPPDQHDLLPAPIDFSRAELVEPGRTPTIGGDFMTPALQSAFSGLVAGVAVLACGGGWTWTGIVAAGSMALSWGLLLADHRATLLRVKRVIGRAEATVPTPAAPVKLQLEVTEAERDGGRISFVELPIDRFKLAMFCKAVLAGKSMSEGTWIGGSNPFALSEYRALRDTLLERGWIRWTNPAAHAQGLELTPAGRAIFRKIAAD